MMKIMHLMAVVILWCGVSGGSLAGDDEAIKPSDPRVFYLVEDKDAALCGFVLNQINEKDRFDNLKENLDSLLGFAGVTLPKWKQVSVDDYSYILVDGFKLSKKNISEEDFLSKIEEWKDNNKMKLFLSELDIDNDGGMERLLLKDILETHGLNHIVSFYILNNEDKFVDVNNGPFSGIPFFYKNNTYIYNSSTSSSASIFKKYIPEGRKTTSLSNKSICVFEDKIYNN